MAKSTWLSNEELTAWKSLALMQLQLNARLHADLAAHDLSLQDYLVLATLSDRKDGRCRLNDVGRELGWEKSRVSHHVTRMCRRGLVAKEACPDDQRGAYVCLTDSGRSAAAQAAPGHVALVRELFISQLSTDELRTVGEVATRVLNRLQLAEPAL